MKKIFFILGLTLAVINPAQADEQQEIDEIQQQVEKYTKECYNKSYPVGDPEKMDYISNMTNIFLFSFLHNNEKYSLITV